MPKRLQISWRWIETQNEEASDLHVHHCSAAAWNSNEQACCWPMTRNLLRRRAESRPILQECEIMGSNHLQQHGGLPEELPRGRGIFLQERSSKTLYFTVELASGFREIEAPKTPYNLC